MKRLILDKQTLVDIADAVRAKTGSTDLVAIEDLDDAVATISGGGGNSLKAFFDVKKSCYYEFYKHEDLTTEQLNSVLGFEDTSSVTDMRYMFRDCTSLTTIPQLDTSAVTNMSYMFQNCSSLTTVSRLDASKASTLTNIFSGCTNLKSILMYDMKENFNISASTKFEREDLVTILNNLATVTSKKLVMGSTNLAKLTDADKAIATGKGWTLA